MHRRDTLTALLFQFERMGLIIVILPYIITARRDRLIFDESPALSARRTDTYYAISYGPRIFEHLRVRKNDRFFRSAGFGEGTPQQVLTAAKIRLSRILGHGSILALI